MSSEITPEPLSDEEYAVFADAAGFDPPRSAMVLTEPEWAVLRSIVCEFASSVGAGITEAEAALVDRIIEATDA